MTRALRKVDYRLPYKRCGIDVSPEKAELTDDDILHIANISISKLNVDSGIIKNKLIQANLPKNFIPKCELVKLIKTTLIPKFYTVSSKQFWLDRGYSIEEARQKSSEARYDRPIQSEAAYWIKRGYSAAEAKQLAGDEIRKRNKKAYDSRDELYKKEKSPRCKEYWIKRGHTEEEAIAEVKHLQGTYGALSKGKIPITSMPAKIEYYLDKGHTLESSTLALLKYLQSTTFTMKNCIKRYGEIEGPIKFKERQEKWQATLNSKSNEEILEINRKKSNKLNIDEYSNSELPAIFYVLKISDDLIKIGISSKDSIYSRYTIDELDKVEIILIKETTLKHAFYLEQTLKSIELKDFKISKNSAIYPYGWTETFRVQDPSFIIEYANLKSLEELREALLDTYMD